MLRLAVSHLEALRREAAAAYPEECCGILLGEAAGEPASVAALLPAANVAAERRHGYCVDPAALLRAHRAARQGGPAVLGYYHSHPDAAAAPSARDRREALAEARYLIVAVRGGAAGEARCFRRDGAGELAEEPLRVEPAGPR